MSIGIIAAEEEEMLAIKNNMKYIIETRYFDLCFYEGEIEEKRCVLVRSGVGKVNAASTAQLMIDKFYVDYIINVGSAGAAHENLNIGDVVIANKLVQYDFNITDIGNYEPGEICEIGKYMYSDSRLIDLCGDAIKEMSDTSFRVKIGVIGTADMFCARPELTNKIRENFQVECLEMEGAAIAQVCNLDKIPCLVIRGISDTPNGNNKIDFHTYLAKASERAANLLKLLIVKI